MRKPKVPRPSPAMAVACTALMVSLGGGAYAATQLPAKSVGTPQLKADAVTAPKIAKDAVVSSRIKNGQVRTEDLRDGTVTRAKLAPDERTVWAAVRGSDGAVLRGSGEVTSVTHIPGSGRYTLVFNREVAACGWVASTSSDATTNQGFAEVQRDGTSTTQLLVLTSKASGAADSDFHVIVACTQPIPK